jgi:AMP-polyphosphate phosphotransferase
MQVDDNVRVLKFFLHITPDEQKKRLIERATIPHKRWKTGTDDYRNRARWDDYTQALHDMFDRTSPGQAPWEIIAANDKKSARIAVLASVVKKLSKGMTLSDPPLDAKLRTTAEAALKIKFTTDGTGLVEKKPVHGTRTLKQPKKAVS